MPNTAIFNSVFAAWSTEAAAGESRLDSNCDRSETARMLAQGGYQVAATNYEPALAIKSII